MTPDTQYIYLEALGLMGLGPDDEPTEAQHKAAMERVERFRREIKEQQEKETNEVQPKNK